MIFHYLAVPEFICSPTRGNTGFHVLEMTHKAAILICVQVFGYTCFQLIWVNGKEYGFCILWWEDIYFCKKLTFFFQSVYTILHSHQ
jgi:hypothetical protein